MLENNKRTNQTNNNIKI